MIKAATGQPDAEIYRWTNERRLIATHPGRWDAIFVNDKTGEIFRERIMFMATVERWTHANCHGRERTEFQEHEIVPVSLSESFTDLNVVDGANYVGVIEAGADPFDPIYGLQLPENAKREAQA